MKKMNRAELLLILIASAIVAGLIFLYSGPKEQATSSQFKSQSSDSATSPIQTDSVPASKEPVYAPQTDSQASVDVTVIPKEIRTNNGKNIFSVSFNTHSVELDYDFAKIMVLKDDLGNEFAALEWSGSRGGHHISGAVTFPKINENAKSVILHMAAIGGVDRTFAWDLK